MFNLQAQGPFQFVSKPHTLALGPIRIPEAERKLVAWWKLDETEGSAISDSSDNKLAGMLIGDPQWQPTGGKVGGALRFDGVDDFVQTNYATDLPVWTIALWVNSPAAPAPGGPSSPIHREKNYQINWDHQFEDFRGAVGTQVGGTWYAASFEDLQPDQWYHLAATYDGESLKAYKDGVLITDNSTVFGTPDAEQETLKLGRHSSYADPSNYFAGAIDDVRIYDYAVSEDDIAAIYAGKDLPTAAKADVLAAGEEEAGTGRSWILVLGIVVVVVAAAGLATLRKKSAV